MADHMTDPSNNFRTGGGPCTLPSLGCLPIIIWGVMSAAIVVVILAVI